MAQSIPDGYRTLTPSFTFKDSKKAIEFYKAAFNAKVLDLFPNPSGPGIMHATIQIGDSIIMMGDESPQCQSAETLGSSPISLYLYVPNADAAFAQAVAAGGTVSSYFPFAICAKKASAPLRICSGVRSCVCVAIIQE